MWGLLVGPPGAGGGCWGCQRERGWGRVRGGGVPAGVGVGVPGAGAGGGVLGALPRACRHGRAGSGSTPADVTKEDKASSESLRLIMVVFLGGCTFSEISALRFLGREKGKREQKGGPGGQIPVPRRLLDL